MTKGLSNDLSFGLLDQIPIGAFVLSSDLTVRFWNRCLEDWSRISRNQIVGQNIGEHFPHLTQPKYTQRFASVFMGGPPTIFSS
ncbi:MAG: PAS domain-containing protein, partial [Leptolyngbyaceae bacterium]|nr:PAS domain-containing protein [Leptolyngbyaceae bacterium]